MRGRHVCAKGWGGGTGPGPDGALALADMTVGRAVGTAACITGP